MFRLIFSIFGCAGAILFLLNRFSSLEKSLQTFHNMMHEFSDGVSAELDANMEAIADLESNLEALSLDTGRAIGELDTEAKLIQLDLYAHLRNDKHWSEEETKFVSVAPYTNENNNMVEVLEDVLKKRGLNFTTKRLKGL